MELDSLDRHLAVTKAHDDAVGLRGHFEVFRKRSLFDDQRVVARGHKILRQILENRFAVVMDAAGLAVHDFRRADHLPSKRLSDRLMAQAHSQNRNLP